MVVWIGSSLRARQGESAGGFPGLAACVAWGWAAGWASPAGGIVVALALLGLLLVGAARHSALRLTTAAAATLSIGSIVVGTAAWR